jgi:hypothetical protein
MLDVLKRIMREPEFPEAIRNPCPGSRSGSPRAADTLVAVEVQISPNHDELIQRLYDLRSRLA